MDHEITLTFDLLDCDYLDRHTEEHAANLLRIAMLLEQEAKDKQAQAQQLREAAETLAKAHLVFDLTDNDGYVVGDLN